MYIYIYLVRTAGPRARGIHPGVIYYSHYYDDAADSDDYRARTGASSVPDYAIGNKIPFLPAITLLFNCAVAPYTCSMNPRRRSTELHSPEDLHQRRRSCIS